MITLDFKDSLLHLKTPYFMPAVHEDLRAFPPNTRTWDNRIGSWLLKPTRAIAKRLITFCDKYRVNVTEPAKGILDWMLGRSRIEHALINQKGLSVHKSNKILLESAEDYEAETLARKFGGRYSKTAGGYLFNPDYLEDIIREAPKAIKSKDIIELQLKPIPVTPKILVKDADIEFTNIKLLDHQKKAVEYLTSKKFAILADDMGLGKTVSALTSAALLSKSDQLPVYVLAPSSLAMNWDIEAERLGLSVKVKSWDKDFSPDESKYILVVDEYQLGSNKESNRAGRLEALSLDSRCQSLIALSGTPSKNGRAKELWPLLRATRHPLAFAPSYYENTYYGDNSDLAGLNKRLTTDNPTDPFSKDILLRRTIDILGLPPKTRHKHFIRLSVEANKVYDAIFGQLQLEYKLKTKDKPITEMDALVLLTHLRKAGSISKVEAATLMAKELLRQNKSVVLFTEFRDTAHQLVANLGAGLIDGTVSNKKIELTKAQFQAGEIKTIVSTYKRGGVGHTLTRSHNFILVDRPWTPADAFQAECRGYRIGQTEPFNSYWLQATKTDLFIDRLLEEKDTNNKLMLGESVFTAGLPFQTMAKQVSKEIFG